MAVASSCAQASCRPRQRGRRRMGIAVGVCSPKSVWPAPRSLPSSSASLPSPPPHHQKPPPQVGGKGEEGFISYVTVNWSSLFARRREGPCPSCPYPARPSWCGWPAAAEVMMMVAMVAMAATETDPDVHRQHHRRLLPRRDGDDEDDDDGGGGGGLLLLSHLWRKAPKPMRVVHAVHHAVVTTFLPVGYPHSVRAGYASYQFWDTVQALCSYLRGVLTTKALLEGSGVGSETASALSAAINWVFRDGVGMTCSLAFSCLASTSFDNNIKEWRLFADVINDVGLTLDMLTSVFKNHFVLLTCLGTICKTLCGVAAGCTKNSITAHFALRGNIADVSAKESTQETAVTLAGILAGLAFASRIADPSVAWPIFLLLTAIHVIANYKGVASLQLRTLNCQRASLLITSFLDNPDDPILTPSQVAERERVWEPFLSYLLGTHPVLGASLQEVVPALREDEYDFYVRRVYSHEKYVLLLVFLPRGRYAASLASLASAIRVLLHADAGPEDELKAFFHAYVIRHLIHKQQEEGGGGGRAGSGAADAGGDGEEEEEKKRRRKMVLSSYQLTAHRFPAFLSRVKRRVVGEGGSSGGGGEGGGDDTSWDLSRVLLGAKGWRLVLQDPIKKDE